MDPEGIREVFYAEQGAALDYGVRGALRSLPFPARWEDSRFVGLHLPLTRPLPKRIDVQLQQYVGLHRYDAIVLAGIDPVVLDPQDLLNLLAYVECGGGLLLMGGVNAFDQAQRNWGPLREALPAGIPPRREIRRRRPSPNEDREKTPIPVSLAQPHPITRGLGGPLGPVTTIQPLHPKEGCAVLATAGGQPLIVAGAHRWGRVVMVGSYPEEGPDSLFCSPGYADLIRQALMWLMGRSEDLVIDRCSMDRSPLPVGTARTFSLEVGAEAPGPVTAKAWVSRADPGWLSAGREPQFGPLQEKAAVVSDRTVRFGFEPEEPGLWRVQIDVGGEGWANRRRVEVEVPGPHRIRLSTRHGKYVSAPGWTLPLQVQADHEVPIRLRVIDFDGEEVFRREEACLGPLDVPLPQLELGHYEAVAETDGEEARLRFYVTDPIRRIPFTLCATTSSNPVEEKSRWLYEYFRDRGFNAHAGLNAYGEYLAQREGFDVWGEYYGAALLSTHGIHGEEGSQPTEPCVFHPEYRARLREVMEEKYSRTAGIPRMASLEILDEPHFYRANVCRCERCQAEFHRRYGYPLPTWDEALAAKDHRTRDYFEFVVDYGAEAFRQGLETWRSLGPGPQLHHVLCGVGSGRYTERLCIAEDLPWTPHADFIEFDCYNYMYPHWRPRGQLRWNEFHYLFGHFRFLGLRNRQRLGFFIQVTDRDVPVAPWDPLRAPSETLYAAVGQGAKTFHLMAKLPFTTVQNCREEKFDTFAEDVRKVQRAAPLLDRAESPRSRIAMTFPFHDRLYRNPEPRLPEGFAGLGFYGSEYRPYDTLWPHHIAPINVAELLFRAFGEVDVIDQRAFHEGALEDYPGFVLNGTDYLADEDAEAIVRFVEGGGVLICDHVPSHNTNGHTLNTLAPLFEGETEHFYGQVTLTRSRYGQGRTLLFSDDLNELYTRSIEENQPGLRYRLKDTVREFFFEAGLRPQALCSNPEIEANVLLTPDTIVLVAVNHAEDRQQGHITLFAPSVPATYGFDLVTMQPYPLDQTGQGIELDLNLEEREGLILGLYAEVPTHSRIQLDNHRLRRGDALGFRIQLTDAQGRPARGDQIVSVRVTDPKGEERRQFGGLLCARNGELRIREPLAVNARLGPWTITAFDRFTTREVTAQFTVEE